MSFFWYNWLGVLLLSLVGIFILLELYETILHWILIAIFLIIGFVLLLLQLDYPELNSEEIEE